LENLHKRGHSEDIGIDGRIVRVLDLSLIVSMIMPDLPHKTSASAGLSVAAAVIRITTTESQILNRILKIGDSMWAGCI
jgi:hypothetical protein